MSLMSSDPKEGTSAFRGLVHLPLVFALGAWLVVASGACGGGGGGGTRGSFQVVEILPVDGAIDVSVNAMVQIRFSRPVSAPSLQSGVTVFLTETGQPGPLPVVVALDATGRVATLTPTQPLSMLTAHQVHLASGVLDLKGRPLSLAQSKVPLPSTFDTQSVPDTTPPLFAGATGAVDLSGSSIEIAWAPASDDTDPPSAIVYNVYTSQISGMQDFTSPDATSVPGATSTVVGSLQPLTTYYFVVRAADTSGNEDPNVVEVFATTQMLPDTTPPIFAGATGTLALSDITIEVQWNPAMDDTDPPSAIVYNIYAAQVSGMQNFATPDATSMAGTTAAVVGGLQPVTTHYFVVRARDTSGNEDSNLVEVSETTLMTVDLMPPVFAGVSSATPVNPVEIQIEWNMATDDQASPVEIVYNIYSATLAGGQNFAAPDDTTAPGALSHTVGGLLPDTDSFFVVRAQDPSGNEDVNVVEVRARTPQVSFATHVQPIFTNNCVFCHGPPAPTEGQDLSSHAAIDSTAINLLANQTMGTTMLDRIEPFDSAASYLIHKIDGTQAAAGGGLAQMPWGGPPLSQSERDIIRHWVDQGALDN